MSIVFSILSYEDESETFKRVVMGDSGSECSFLSCTKIGEMSGSSSGLKLAV